MDVPEPSGALTRIQHEILVAIRNLTQDLRHPPCMREVLDKVNLASVSALAYQYKNLEALGYLRREAGQPRTVEVRLPGEPAFPPEPDPASKGAREEKVAWVPIVGRIAAGAPILAQQSVEDYLPLPKEVTGGQEGVFMLEVVGDSMIGVGIFPGDLVVVSQLFQDPQNGDIVAATIDGVEPEGTVKTYKKVDGHVWLMPQNPAYTPILGDKAKVAGKVVAVLRRF